MKAAYVLAGLRVDDEELKRIFSGDINMPKLPVWDEMELRGQVKQMHRMLLLLGRDRFGEPDAATEAALKEVSDLDRLERMSRAILTSDSWDELLATP